MFGAAPVPVDQIDLHLLKEYEIVSKIGSGSYGHVWQGTRRTTGREVALKKVFDAFNNSTDAQRTFREVVILLELERHPNLVALYDVSKSVDDRHLYLVFDYMDSDLHVAIQSRALQPVHMQYVIYQILCALHFLHSAFIVHRDLKPSNVLLNESCEVKLCDFGFARSVVSQGRAGKTALGPGLAGPQGAQASPPGSESARQCSPGGATAASSGELVVGSASSSTEGLKEEAALTDNVSTRWFRSPEILFCSTQYDQSVDLWSLGCILGEMLSGNPIFPGKSILHQLQLIFEVLGVPSDAEIEAALAPDCRRFAREILPCVVVEKRSWGSAEGGSLSMAQQRDFWVERFLGAPVDALQLLQRFLSFAPQDRPSAGEALEHEYVRDFRNPAMEMQADRRVQMALDDNTKFVPRDYFDKIMDNFVGDAGCL